MSEHDATESTEAGGTTRRDVLVKAGAVAAGAVAAGSLAGSASAAKRSTFATPKIRYGGRILWALEQDPVHVAPYGAILTSNHWGKQAAYDSLVEWDKNLNLKPALADVVEDLGRPEVDHVQPAPRRQVPQRQGARRRRREVLGREDAQPAAAGQHHDGQPGAGVPRGRRRLEVRRPAEPQDPRRARLRVPRLGALLADRPRGPLRPDQRRPQRDRHGALPHGGLRSERPRRVRGEQELLEEGPAVHGRDDAEDAARRAGPHRGAARRRDRRRHASRATARTRSAATRTSPC